MVQISLISIESKLLGGGGKRALYTLFAHEAIETIGPWYTFGTTLCNAIPELTILLLVQFLSQSLWCLPGISSSIDLDTNYTVLCCPSFSDAKDTCTAAAS